MNIKNRIQLIGIICIFLGTCGIVWGIVGLVLPHSAIMTNMDISEITFDLQKKLGREINYHKYPKAELKKKIKEKNHFLLSLKNEKKIFLKGNKNEFKKFFQ